MYIKPSFIYPKPWNKKLPDGFLIFPDCRKNFFRPERKFSSRRCCTSFRRHACSGCCRSILPQCEKRSESVKCFNIITVFLWLLRVPIFQDAPRSQHFRSVNFGMGGCPKREIRSFSGGTGSYKNIMGGNCRELPPYISKNIWSEEIILLFECSHLPVNSGIRWGAFYERVIWYRWVYSGRKNMCSFFHGKEKIIECFYGFIDTDYIDSGFCRSESSLYSGIWGRLVD